MGVVVLGAGLRHGEVAKRYLASDFGAVFTISQSNTQKCFRAVAIAAAED